MLDKKALILIAHSDRPTLMALYTLLDAEGYFVAPCFSEGDLLRYCEQYQPELIMTNPPQPGDGRGRLLETLRERSPKTRILLLPDVLDPGSIGPLLHPRPGDGIPRIAKGPPVAAPFHRNGF